MKLLLSLILAAMTYTCYCQNSHESIKKNAKSSVQNGHLEALEKLADSAFVNHFNGNYKKAIQTNFALLDLAWEADSPYYLHKGYSSLGYNYLVQRDTLKAIESFKKSEKYATLSKNDTALARMYMDIAHIYASKKDNEGYSYQYFDKSINLFNKLRDSSSLASAHYYAIVDAMERKDFKRSLSHIKSIDSYINNIEDDNFCEISVNSQKASYHTQLGNYKIADTFFSKVIDSSIQKEFFQELEQTYEAYSESLFLQGRLERAYDARKKYEFYYRKNEEGRRSQENRNLVTKFEIAEYKKDLAKAELESSLLSEIARNKTTNNTLLIILSLILACFFIYLINVILKKRQLVERLKNKNEKYLTARQDAERLSNSKSKFLSTVSHELRTPLYGVIGLSAILLEDKGLSKHKETLDSLKFSADYLLALINDVLQINKIESSEEEEEKTTFCIKNLVETMVSSFDYKKTTQNNQINIHIPENTPDLIAGNRARLSQILMNLISNAIKFTNNGTIDIIVETITLPSNELELQFTVRDTGIGIAKEQQENIFEEFSQIEGSDPNQEGTGLGLSIVKRLLQTSGKDIVLESELGKGSTFTFSLPFDLIQQKISENDSSQPLIVTKSLASLEGLKILIVDDNKVNRMVTQKILEKYKANCEQAVDGVEALEKAKKYAYDIILMDVNMPNKNGIEATIEIRQFNKTVPIIALTAVEMHEMRDQIKNSGMNDIIVKPYNLNEFEQVLLRNINDTSENANVMSA